MRTKGFCGLQTKLTGHWLVLCHAAYIVSMSCCSAFLVCMYCNSCFDKDEMHVCHPAAHTVCIWLYTTLLPAGLPAVVIQASPAKAATKATSPASSWALRALKQNSSKQTHMLESLLMQHLQKQLLLTGNPIIVPVLGHCCVFRSVHITALPVSSIMPTGLSACFLTFATLQ